MAPTTEPYPPAEFFGEFFCTSSFFNETYSWHIADAHFSALYPQADSDGARKLITSRLLLPDQQSQLFGATGDLRPVHLSVFGRQQTPAGTFQNGS